MKYENPVKPNYLEIESVEDANRVDMEVYRLERFSDTRNAFIFVRRRGK